MGGRSSWPGAIRARVGSPARLPGLLPARARTPLAGTVAQCPVAAVATASTALEDQGDPPEKQRVNRERTRPAALLRDLCRAPCVPLRARGSRRAELWSGHSRHYSQGQQPRAGHRSAARAPMFGAAAPCGRVPSFAGAGVSLRLETPPRADPLSLCCARVGLGPAWASPLAPRPRWAAGGHSAGRAAAWGPARRRPVARSHFLGTLRSGVCLGSNTAHTGPRGAWEPPFAGFRPAWHVCVWPGVPSMRHEPAQHAASPAVGSALVEGCPGHQGPCGLPRGRERESVQPRAGPWRTTAARPPSPCAAGAPRAAAA